MKEVVEGFRITSAVLFYCVLASG